MNEAPRLRLSPAIWIGVVVAATVAFGIAHTSPEYVLPLVYAAGFVCVAVLVKASIRAGRSDHWIRLSADSLTEGEWAAALAGSVVMFVTILVGWYQWT
jgi:hypothetical protein